MSQHRLDGSLPSLFLSTFDAIGIFAASTTKAQRNGCCKAEGNYDVLSTRAWESPRFSASTDRNQTHH
jgi:hypothetical protein